MSRWDFYDAHAVVDDLNEVAYPDADGMLFTCLQAHTSQNGWEPPVVSALWKAKDTLDDAALVSHDVQNENEA